MGIDMEPNSTSIDHIDNIIIRNNVFYNHGKDPYGGAGKCPCGYLLGKRQYVQEHTGIRKLYLPGPHGWRASELTSSRMQPTTLTSWATISAGISTREFYSRAHVVTVQWLEMY